MGTVNRYRDLNVYQPAFELAVEIDRVSKQLPKHEMYEVGSQIRRSAVMSNPIDHEHHLD